MAKGCGLESEQLWEARLGGLSDEDVDSVSSHPSPRASGTKMVGMSELSPYDSRLFSRNGDDSSVATPTDNEVSKYSFFERLKHHMEGNLITKGNRTSVKLCIFVKAGAAVRGMDPMKKEKKETVYFNKYMTILDEIEDSMFSQANLRNSTTVESGITKVEL